MNKNEKSKRITLWVSEECFEDIQFIGLLNHDKHVNSTVMKIIQDRINVEKNHPKYLKMKEFIRLRDELYGDSNDSDRST